MTTCVFGTVTQHVCMQQSMVKWTKYIFILRVRKSWPVIDKNKPWEKKNNSQRPELCVCRISALVTLAVVNTLWLPWQSWRYFGFSSNDRKTLVTMITIAARKIFWFPWQPLIATSLNHGDTQLPLLQYCSTMEELGSFCSNSTP